MLSGALSVPEVYARLRDYLLAEGWTEGQLRVVTSASMVGDAAEAVEARRLAALLPPALFAHAKGARGAGAGGGAERAGGGRVGAAVCGDDEHVPLPGAARAGSAGATDGLGEGEAARNPHPAWSGTRSSMGGGRSTT